MAHDPKDEINPDAPELPSPVDPDDALREFQEYDSLQDEDEDDRSPPVGLSLVEDLEDAERQVTPKDRRVAEMRLEAKVEAIVFAAQKPLRPQEILDLLNDTSLTVEDVQTTLDLLVEFYADRSGGFKLLHLKRLGYQFQTSENAGPIMERMFASRPRPISRAALETLSIIAYRQPATRAEIEFIRGVDAGSIFKTLLERELIRCVGRKEIVGRPMLFGTTDQFLTVFNLSSIKDLPSLESFQPAREMVQGAMDKISDADSQLIDVEEYIADNTQGEYEEGADDELDLELAGDGDLPPVPSPEASPLSSEVSRIQGATAKDLPPVTGAQNPEEAHGTDAHSKVVVPDGNRVPPPSGDVDL